MTEWAAEELAWVRLKDKRHQSRLVRIVERLAERPAVSIPAACQNWAETKGAYRFFGSGRVDAEAIRLGHQAKTLERMQGKEWVIVAQDSSELNFTGRHNLQGLGGLRKKGEQGLYLHSGLAISIEGVRLGWLFPFGRDGRIWGHPRCLHPSKRSADGKLHNRPVWIIIQCECQ